MEYCIIIRGPAGVGKTTITKKLAKEINAKYFSFDKIMESNKLDHIVGDGIPSKNFIKANKIILHLIKEEKRIILDGCFYRKKQISNLLKNLKTKVYIFTLNTTILECTKRNKKRKNPLKNYDVEQVHNLVSKLKIGINIDTTKKNIKKIVLEILNHINC